MSWGLEHECSRKTHPTTWPGLWRQSRPGSTAPATAAPSPSCPASSLAVGPMLPAPWPEAPWILQLKHLSSTSSGFQGGGLVPILLLSK